ncbi:TIGR04139 family peptide modification target [Chryseobacterium culicis]|uniref:Grasp-with-spasm system A modified peptide n=1 Tax=Chryseobacterium culicis TaxID=680127 RepID=A0A2S9CJR8_CHRCI|nr:TIGR04139 family peptide modification target [Chryseobacterium culicis]PRB80774.1 grasp-with-spasm system A modified peptide [Chryseobacterium culicis]PRB87623.1 grasp-with-spasm system A modified peptide [Chryseobacterium culicis]
MKKLNGMKSNFSSLENKKLKDLKTIQGGSYNVKSNVSVGEGCEEYDTYTSPGGAYIGRITVCSPRLTAAD